VLTIVVYFLLLFSTASLLINILYLSRRAKLQLPESPKKISVLIPVRNEEGNIRQCLDSLLRQSYPNLDITVIDDDSHDGSWAILKEYAAKHREKIRVFQSKPLPEGWIGKNWACFQLSQRADGDWLLFTDADTRHGEHSVLAAHNEAITRQASLISYLPDLVAVSLAEKIVIPIINFFFYLVFPLSLLKRIKNPLAAVAIGTFLLIRRETYFSFDGHRGLKEDIVEDIGMARMVKKAGEDCDLIDGTGVFFTRWYSNLSGIWNGLTKNAFGAFGYSVAPFILVLLYAFFVFLNPFIRLFLSGNLSFYTPAFNQVLIILSLRLVLALKTKHNILYILFHPLMIIFSIGFAINSMWRILRKAPINWKERSYRISK
jgi:chlorobactene glucosyltransferase